MKNSKKILISALFLIVSGLSSAYAQSIPRDARTAVLVRQYLLEWHAALSLRPDVFPEISRNEAYSLVSNVRFERVEQEGMSISCDEDSIIEPGGARLRFAGPFCFTRRYDRIRIGSRALQSAETDPREGRVIAGWILFRMSGRSGVNAAQMRGLVNELWGDHAGDLTPVTESTALSMVYTGTTVYETEDLARRYWRGLVAGYGESQRPRRGAWFVRSEQDPAHFAPGGYRVRASARVGLGGGVHHTEDHALGTSSTSGTGGASMVVHGVASHNMGTAAPWEPTVSLDVRAALEASADRPLYTMQLNLSSSLAPLGIGGLWGAVDANQFSALSEKIARLGFSVLSAPIDFGGGDYLMIQLGVGRSWIDLHANGHDFSGNQIEHDWGTGGDLSAILRAGSFFVLVRGRYDVYSPSGGAYPGGEQLERFAGSASVSLPLGALLANDGLRLEADVVHYLGATRNLLGELPPESRVNITTGTVRLLYEAAF